jgi:hypothetical protein
MVNLHSGPTPRGREGSAAADAIEAAAMNHAPAAFILNRYRKKVKTQQDNPKAGCLILAPSSPKPKATPLPSKHVRALIAILISRYLIVPTLSHVSLSILPLGTSQSQELIQFMIPGDEIANYEDLRDCVSELLISKLSGTADKKKKKASKGRKNEIKPVSKPEQGQEDNDALAADLGETIEVC